MGISIRRRGNLWLFAITLSLGALGCTSSANIRATKQRQPSPPIKTTAFPTMTSDESGSTCDTNTVATSTDGEVVATTTCDQKQEWLQIWSHDTGSWHTVGPPVRRPPGSVWSIAMASESNVLALGSVVTTEDTAARSFVWVMAFHTSGWVALGDSFAITGDLTTEESMRRGQQEISLSGDGTSLSVTTAIGEEQVVFELNAATLQWIPQEIARANVESAADDETKNTSGFAYYKEPIRDVPANERILQGTFDITAASVEYNDGAQGTPGISAPTIVVVFEHDDVTGVSPSVTPYGDVVVTHYDGNCKALLSQSLGASVEAPDIPSAAPLVPSPTMAPTFADSVQTTILYDFNQLQSLSASAGIVETDTSTTPSTTIIPYCVRLGLTDTSGSNEVAFREANIMVKFPSDDDTMVTADFADNFPFTPPEDLGDYSIQSTFCSPLPTPYLTQGQSFEVCLEPLDGALSPTTDIEISVQDFLFFIDVVDNNLLDTGETNQVGVASGVANTPSTTSPTCGVDVVTAASGVYGCRFTTQLRSEFFQPNPQEVLGKGSIAMSFVLNRNAAGANRDVRVASSPILELVIGTAATEGSCTDDCFVLLCWAVWLFCFVKDFFSLVVGLF